MKSNTAIERMKSMAKVGTIQYAIIQAKRKNPQISVNIQCGKYRICEVHYKANGSSKVVELSKGLDLEDTYTELMKIAA